MNSSTHSPSWLKHAVFYQIYPQSFCDTNSDGIGDLPGIISKLDYLQSLGINALWLNPIFESPFGDAGYDISDFRKVAPRYGTNKDAVKLFQEAHKRGMHVVMDLVAGHTSDQHPWFKQACKKERTPYTNHFIFTGDEPQKPMFGDRPSLVPGTRPGYFLANFLPFQPALNYGYLNPDPAKPWQLPTEHPDCLAVRNELQQIMKFWLDLGCDGFRVDMASSLIKEDKDAVALTRLWQGFRSWFDLEYPEAVLVSEWSNPIQAITAGFHIDFMIHFGDIAYTHLVGSGNALEGNGRRPHVFFERAGEGDIMLFLEPYLRHYTKTLNQGYVSLPTGNHDFQRPRLGRDFEELRVFFAMIFTMPGVPFIYYGDEIGMRNIDGLPEKEGSMWRTGNRTPMQWDKNAPNLGFSAAHKKKLYLPVDPAPDAPTVSEQETNPDSHLNFTRALIKLRQKHSALGNDGAFKSLYAKSGLYPFVYERSDAKGRYAIALNPGETSVELNLEILKGAKLILGQNSKLKGSDLTLSGVSFAIYRLAN